MAAAATATITTSFDQHPTTVLKASDVGKRDIETDLHYWVKVDNNQRHVDFTRPDAHKVQEELANLVDTHKILIHDVRGEESEYTLDKNGFQYVKHDVPDIENWSDEEKVKEILIPATEKLVAEITGANKVIRFADRIRCFATDEAKHAQNRAPAHSVHSDFTITGALQNLHNIVKDPAEVERLLRGRVLAINVWRPLQPIRKDPLAVCDWTSVDPKHDWVAYRMTHGGGWNELGQQNFSEKHKWFYLRHQDRNEPLLFKQFDSRDETGSTLAHSAFVDPEYMDFPARQSIEIKMYAFIPEEAK